MANKFTKKNTLSSQFSEIPQSQKITIGIIIVVGLALVCILAIFKIYIQKQSNLV